MIRFALAGVFCSLSTGLQADDAKDKALKALQGEWKVMKIVDKGEEVPKDIAEKLTFTVKGNELIPSDMPKDVATIALDLAQKQAWFDITDRSKETMLGIYELKGDTLTICLADPKATRPKEFASSKESKTTLLVLKRAGK